MLQAISQEIKEQVVMNSRQCHTLAMMQEVENLKPIQICEKLRKYGISPDEGWQGYERAKKVIFRGLCIDSHIRDLHIKIITDYLGL